MPLLVGLDRAWTTRLIESEFGVFELGTVALLVASPAAAYAPLFGGTLVPDLTAPGHRVDSVGLEADLDNNTLELRSRVRGTINAAG